MSALQSALVWLRQNLAWSNSRQSWEERLGVLVLVAGAAVIFGYGGGLDLGQQLVLWLIWLAALAAVLRRGWLKLFGPVLFYDMVRVGRRSRYLILRTLFIIGLFLMMAYTYWMWSLQWSMRQAFAGTVPARELGSFAESFFQTFMSTQFLVLLILTPAYVAGAIADEKNRRTLEFLLATDLRNREIVLGKLISRLANLLMLVLAGLPILAFMQFFGGVDPDLLLAGFVAQAVTVFSMAGLSVLFSVYSRRPRDAIVLTYLGLFAYPLLAIGFYGVAQGFGWIDLGVTLPVWGLRGTLGDLLAFLNAGNPVFIVWVLFYQQVGGGGRPPPTDLIQELHRNYLIFHGVLGLVCIAWAVARLRAIALKEAAVTEERSELSRKVFRRPAMGADGMIWKEVFVETGWKLNWMGRIILGLLVAASFLPAGIILYNYLDQLLTNPVQVYRREDFFGVMNALQIRGVGTIVACLTLLGVTVRAASSIGGERDRQTFDALLTTPLDSSRILWAKWLGSVLCMRWAAVWLGAIWLVGLLTGSLHVLAVPFLMLAWLVYAGCFAMIGLWFSIVSKSTGRATLWSLLVVLFIGGGHFCLGSTCCCAPFMMIGRGDFFDSRYLFQFLMGQTPVVVLGAFAFQGEEFKGGDKFMSELMVFSFIGLACWTVAALFLSNLASVRFRQLTNRDDQLGPTGFARQSLHQGLSGSLQRLEDDPVLDAQPVENPESTS